MRLNHLFEDLGEAHRVEGRVLAGQALELGQDVAAALDLLAQQRHVLADRPVFGSTPASSLVTRAMVASGVPSSWAAAAAEPVELVEVLLAGEHQLGGGERVGELPLLLGHLPDIHADEQKQMSRAI